MGVPLRGVGVPSVGTGMASTGDPERYNTEQCVHSNSALSCGPRKAVEESRVYSTHMFCFKHGGRGGHEHLLGKGRGQIYTRLHTVICTWRSEKYKLKSTGPYPRGSHSPDVTPKQALEPDHPRIHLCLVTTSV